MVSRDDFLRDLGLQVVFIRIESRDNPRFPRVVELVNKTNQFNTTGRRWSAEEMEEICKRGIVLGVDAVDRFTSYGLISVALFADGIIEQVVMSCRVVGLDIELATLAAITSYGLQTSEWVSARTIETRSNLLSRDLFERGGWRYIDGVWRTSTANPKPAHIRFA